MAIGNKSIGLKHLVGMDRQCSVMLAVVYALSVGVFFELNAIRILLHRSPLLYSIGFR